MNRCSMPDDVRNETYRISPYLNRYTVREPEQLINNFVDWVICTEGQQAIRSAGYIPLFDIKS
ncbi:MAG: hypothetical protein AB1728_01390 [Bacteroidota bacterium]